MQVYCLVLLLGLVSLLPAEARWKGRGRDEGPKGKGGVRWHLATAEEECGQTEQLSEGSPGDACQDETAGDKVCLCLSRREEWNFVCGECTLRWKGDFKGAVRRNRDKEGPGRWGGGKQSRRGNGKESRRGNGKASRRGNGKASRRHPGGRRGGTRRGPDGSDSTEMNVEDATTMNPYEAVTENAVISEAEKKRRRYTKNGDKKGNKERFKTRRKLRQKFKHNKQRNGHHGLQEGKWRKKNHHNLHHQGGRRKKDHRKQEDRQDQDQVTPKGTEQPAVTPTAEQDDVPSRQSMEASAAAEPIAPRVNRRRRRKRSVENE